MPIIGFRTHLGYPLPSILNSITSTKTPFLNKNKAILPDSGGLNLLEASIQPFVIENRLGLLNTQADLIGSEHTVKERLNGYHVMRASGVLYTTHTDSAEKSAGLKVRT